MSKYLDRLSQGKDAKEAAAAKLSEAHAKASVQQKIASLNAQSATLQAAYNSALGSPDFNVDNVVKITKEIAQNAADLETVQGILTDEFGG